MRIEIVAVYDSAAQMFMRPFFTQSTGMAVRSFGDEVKRSAADNDLYKHPEDFTLYHLGTFDDSNGLFDLPSGPTVLVRGKDMAIKES